MLHSIVIVFTLLVSIYAEKPCSPELKEVDRSLEIEKGGVITLGCSFTSCLSISTVVFKKEGIAVYEAFSNGKKAALGRSSGYSLKDRPVEYFPTRTNHILSIDPAELEDHGKWSCLVIDTNGDEYTSKEIMINIYEKPEDENILRDKINFKPFTNKNETFTCEVKNVHPQPTLVWILNGEQKNGTSERHVKDGLWSVVNTLQLTFDKAGNLTLECLMSAGDKHPWIKRVINIDVKDGAKVVDTDSPKQPINGNFTLMCNGSGYKSSIKWMKNGIIITPNERFDIDFDNSEENNCSSVLKSKPFECGKADEYEGDYRCVVDVDTDSDGQSDSTDESQPIVIAIEGQDERCTLEKVLIALCVIIAVVALIIVAVILVCKKKKKDMSWQFSRAPANEQSSSV